MNTAAGKMDSDTDMRVVAKNIVCLIITSLELVAQLPRLNGFFQSRLHVFVR